MKQPKKHILFIYSFSGYSVVWWHFANFQRPVKAKTTQAARAATAHHSIPNSCLQQVPFFTHYLHHFPGWFVWCIKQVFKRVFWSSYSYQSFRWEWNLQKWKVIYLTSGRSRGKRGGGEADGDGRGVAKEYVCGALTSKALYSVESGACSGVHLHLPPPPPPPHPTAVYAGSRLWAAKCVCSWIPIHGKRESVKNLPQNMHMPWDADDVEAVKEKWQTVWYFSHIAQLPVHVFAIPPKLQMMVMINFIRTLALTFFWMAVLPKKRREYDWTA